MVIHSGYHPYIDENLSVQTHTVTHSIMLESTTMQIGNIITFGAHKWRVLDIQGGRAMVISEYVLEHRGYHTSNESITWADCSLRSYLNNEFYNSNAFSNTDRSRIAQVTNTKENNQWYGTNGGANTNDRIFLLSLAEVVKYFGDSGQLANRPSGVSWINDQYNSNRIATTIGGSASWWWLRSPGHDSNGASLVSNYGYIYLNGGNVFSSNIGGVRPALWLIIMSGLLLLASLRLILIHLHKFLTKWVLLCKTGFKINI